MYGPFTPAAYFSGHYWPRATDPAAMSRLKVRAFRVAERITAEVVSERISAEIVREEG